MVTTNPSSATMDPTTELSTVLAVAAEYCQVSGSQPAPSASAAHSASTAPSRSPNRGTIHRLALAYCRNRKRAAQDIIVRTRAVHTGRPCGFREPAQGSTARAASGLRRCDAA